MRKFLVEHLTSEMEGQLLTGGRLPAGAYNLEVRPACTTRANEFDVLVDGVVVRHGLSKGRALKVAAMLRAAYREAWMGRQG